MNKKRYQGNECDLKSLTKNGSVTVWMDAKKHKFTDSLQKRNPEDVWIIVIEWYVHYTWKDKYFYISLLQGHYFFPHTHPKICN